MRRLSAFDALGRGLANVRGNLELVAVVAGGSILVVAVVLATMIPWLGFDAADISSWLAARGEGAEIGDLAALARRVFEVFSDLGAFLLALILGLTAGSLVVSWYLGGVLGVLVAGDAQAPGGPGRPALLFRTWSWRFFVGESNRLTWRVLLYYSLFLTLTSIAMLVLVLLVVAASLVATKSGVAAGLALGCGGSLPLLFVFFALVLALSMGQGDLVRAESGVVAASRAGFGVVGRRLGAAIGIFAVVFLASIALGIFQAVLTFVLGLALAARPFLSMTVQVVIFLLQLLAGGWLNLVLYAAFIALLRSERALEAAPAA